MWRFLCVLRWFVSEVRSSSEWCMGMGLWCCFWKCYLGLAQYLSCKQNESLQVEKKLAQNLWNSRYTGCSKGCWIRFRILGWWGWWFLGPGSWGSPTLWWNWRTTSHSLFPKKIWCSGMMNQKTLMGSPAARLKDPKSFIEHIDWFTFLLGFHATRILVVQLVWIPTPTTKGMMASNAWMVTNKPTLTVGAMTLASHLNCASNT